MGGELLHQRRLIYCLTTTTASLFHWQFYSVPDTTSKLVYSDISLCGPLVTDNFRSPNASLDVKDVETEATRFICDIPVISTNSAGLNSLNDSVDTAGQRPSDVVCLCTFTTKRQHSPSYLLPVSRVKRADWPSCFDDVISAEATPKCRDLTLKVSTLNIR